MARPILILASSSPRRTQYLRELGFSFRSVAPEVDEARLRGESPRRYVRRLARAKAGSVARRYPEHWVLGADTTVALGSSLLGKPRSRQEARRMLRRLSGRGHRVLSGIALMNEREGFARSVVSSTRVVFRRLTEEEVRWYVGTGEPFDKAGGYGIQGKGGFLVARIEGSFSNVVGFPVEKFIELWRAAGLPLPR